MGQLMQNNNKIKVVFTTRMPVVPFSKLNFSFKPNGDLFGRPPAETSQEGAALLNHIQNCQLMTNKRCLHTSLRDFGWKRDRTILDYQPETYSLDDPREWDALKFSLYKGKVLF